MAMKLEVGRRRKEEGGEEEITRLDDGTGEFRKGGESEIMRSKHAVSP